MLKIQQIIKCIGLLALVPTVGCMAQKPIMSTSGNQVWYNVVSAAEGTVGMAMTDRFATSADFPVGVETLQEELASQQWKLVQADEDGRLVYLVNRNSGNILQPVSKAARTYQVVQLGKAVDAGKGFVLTGLGRGQYAFVGTETDGQTRGLVAMQQGQTIAEEEPTQGSPYAWTFRLADATGVKLAQKEKPTIFVRGGRIDVPGTTDFRVVRADGVEMSKTARLAPGIYVVTVGGRTAKVIINK
ncbi:MAG: hypothetical protein IJ244_06780 [Bacteroidaceae bacterium]|nr:hypothetical protein [Bacteroidaceae bacterium]